MKRKLLLCAVVLIIMLAAKYALGQDTSEAAWDPITECSFGSGWGPEPDLWIPMLLAPIVGIGFALVRMLSQRLSGPRLQPLRISLPPK